MRNPDRKFPFTETGKRIPMGRVRLNEIREHPEKFDMSPSTPKEFAVDMISFFVKIFSCIAAVFLGIALFVTVSKILGAAVAIILAAVALVSHAYKRPAALTVRIAATVLAAGMGVLLFVLF